MSLSYNVLRKKPIVFLRTAGMSVAIFDEIMVKFKPLWEKAHKKKKGVGLGGRHYKLSPEDLMLMIYYRCYITQEFLGHLFGLEESRVCRVFQKVSKILSKVFTLGDKIKITREVTKEELESLIADVTEQPIQRPKKNQKPYYSGKKKDHTVKAEMKTTLKGRIVAVSPTVPGSVHDFTLHKQGELLPSDTRIFVDSGYQGLDKLHQATELPYKKPKGGTLTEDEKEYNAALSKIRVKIEHIFGDIKTFKIMHETFRNSLKTHNRILKIISGIVNMKNGFI